MFYGNRTATASVIQPVAWSPYRLHHLSFDMYLKGTNYSVTGNPAASNTPSHLRITEVTKSFKIYIQFYQCIRRHIPDDRNLQYLILNNAVWKATIICLRHFSFCIYFLKHISRKNQNIFIFVLRRYTAFEQLYSIPCCQQFLNYCLRVGSRTATRHPVGDAESTSDETKDYMAFHTVYLFTKCTLFYFVLDCEKQILTFNQYMWFLVYPLTI